MKEQGDYEPADAGDLLIGGSAMEYRVDGEIAQRAVVTLDEGDALWASRSAIMAHSRDIDWRLRVPGGVSGAARRMLSGEGLALTRVESASDGQRVLLTANAPGHIMEWDLADGPVLTTRGAFLAAWGESVDINVTVAKRAGAAFFGGAGLFLQRLSGRGTVLIHGSGDFEDVRLGDGEELTVSTGNLAAFGAEVDYRIKGVSGVRQMLFGGEGFFMTRLIGPGRVLLQTLKRGR